MVNACTDNWNEMIAKGLSISQRARMQPHVQLSIIAGLLTCSHNDWSSIFCVYDKILHIPKNDCLALWVWVYLQNMKLKVIFQCFLWKEKFNIVQTHFTWTKIFQAVLEVKCLATYSLMTDMGFMIIHHLLIDMCSAKTLILKGIPMSVSGYQGLYEMGARLPLSLPGQ